MKYFIPLLLIILLCTCTEKKVIIKVQVNSKNITLEGKEIEKDDFENELEKLVEEKLELGLDQSELIIHVNADKETSKYEMSEIEKAIRCSRLDKQYFWKER